MWLSVFSVGYILGLGDRHVQNILIDKQTAELVHIDLGTSEPPRSDCRQSWIGLSSTVFAEMSFS